MKKIIIAAAALLFLSATAYSQLELEAPDWDVKKSDHFILYSKNASPGYINETIEKAEGFYETITDRLGFTRFDNFWTWDKRVKIYLFKDMDEYQKKSKQPSWSSAGVNIYKREIVTYINMSDFFESALPHELGHIIFREFVGYEKKLPLFLDEGVASYLEDNERGDKLIVAKALAAAKANVFMDLKKLSEAKKGDIGIPAVFYSESASVIDFLIDVYGKEKFVLFCKELRQMEQGRNWFTALKDVYYFQDLSQMNDAWMEFLLKK